MYYTYILESLSRPEKHYIGYTSDLKQRLSDHNSGRCSYTATFRPWKVKVYIAFEDQRHAQQFELYLKSGSGHAFINRHFFNTI